MQQHSNKNLQLTKILGELVRELRIKNTGLSCAKLADEYDLDRGNLNRVENGHNDPKVSTFWRIAEALGLKFSELSRMLEDKLGEDFKLIDE